MANPNAPLRLSYSDVYLAVGNSMQTVGFAAYIPLGEKSKYKCMRRDYILTYELQNDYPKAVFLILVHYQR